MQPSEQTEAVAAQPSEAQAVAAVVLPWEARVVVAARRAQAEPRSAAEAAEPCAAEEEEVAAAEPRVELEAAEAVRARPSAAEEEQPSAAVLAAHPSRHSDRALAPRQTTTSMFRRAQESASPARRQSPSS